MEPIHFPESNRVLYPPADPSDRDIRALPICEIDGLSVSCWRLGFAERIRAAIFGRVWLTVVTRTVQPPVGLYVGRVFFDQSTEGA